MTDCICCNIRQLPADLQVAAADEATRLNPLNFPLAFAQARSKEITGDVIKERIAVKTNRYWGPGGRKFSVKFLDTNEATLKSRILTHLNAWSNFCNVAFVESASASADVRISRIDSGDMSGYWSYLGTDILQIPAGQPTMNLQGFSAGTSESEFRRVVRHEAGHTLGCPHEHMRSELVARLDRKKVIAYYKSTQGWTEQEVINQVLTPISEASIMGTPNADRNSIMCYQIPGSLTVDGVPIPGGNDIDQQDASFMSTIYPKPHADTVEGVEGGLSQEDLANALRSAREDIATLRKAIHVLSA